MENSTQVNPYNEHCVRLAISICKAAVQCYVVVANVLYGKQSASSSMQNIIKRENHYGLGRQDTWDLKCRMYF